MDKKELYKPFKYTGKGFKKYSVYVKSDKGNKKLIHFGDSRYGQFKDKLGAYKNLDHGDPKIFIFSCFLSMFFIIFIFFS